MCDEAGMHIAHLNLMDGLSFFPSRKKGLLFLIAVIFSDKEEIHMTFTGILILNIEQLLCPIAF